MIKDNFANILESAAHRFPDNIALITEEKSLTYEQLYSSVYSIVRSFLDFGIETGDMIVCLLPNGIEIVITHFAAAKAGAILVPLSPNLKLQELTEIFKDIKPKMLIAHVSMKGLINALDQDITEQLITIWVGATDKQKIKFNDLINNYPHLDIYLENKGNQLCSIIYTSEITGNLRGVMRTHENNLWAAVGTSINRQYKPGDLELFLLPLDSVAFYNMFAPNIIGGSTVLLQEGFNLDKLIKAFDKYFITRIYLLSHMWDMLISHPEFHQHNFGSLRQLFVGSTPMSFETNKRIYANFPGVELYSVWGLTEGGQIGIVIDDDWKKEAALGQPTFFNKFEIVDDQGYKVPPGRVGEIILYGKTVSPGYYKDREETLKRFHNGWFYTSCLAMYDEDGYVHLIGRKSNIIVSGDYQIFPEEVESALLMNTGILEAAVFGIPNNPPNGKGQSVVAMVVKQKGSNLTENEINDFLDKYIANYKKPKMILFVEKLPKSATGKLTKRKLMEKIKSMTYKDVTGV